MFIKTNTSYVLKINTVKLKGADDVIFIKENEIKSRNLLSVIKS